MNNQISEGQIEEAHRVTYDIVRKALGRMKPSKSDALYEYTCLLYTSPSPRDKRQSRMPSSA